MASKTVLRLESELDKCRSDANWAKVLDVAKQISSKGSQLGSLVTFVQAESQLERFVLENPPNEDNAALARDKLQVVQRQFSDILMDHTIKPPMKEEARLLLAKIHYAMGDYLRCMSVFEEMALDNITVTGVSNRKLQLVAEAYAMKGLCLEKTPPQSSSKYKLAEREAAIISCFEKSGDISLVQLQDKQECGSKGSTSIAVQAGGQWNVLDADSASVGPLVETAIQRSPLLYIRNGELSKGVGRFRELLQAVETRAFQGIRQTLARQLAEVLLRGVCESTYIPPNTERKASHSKQELQPRKYRGDSLFHPEEQNEEILLLLLISESIAAREALLNRSPEYTDARLQTFHNTTAVYDLLTLTLVRRAQFSMLSETFERSLKFSFDEFHIWYQFALSLICAEKHTRGYLVLKECLRLQPDHTVIHLTAAKLCYLHLHLLDEGLSHSSHAVEHDDSCLAARGFIYLGVGYSMKADDSRLRQERSEYQNKALENFQRAVSVDEDDYLVHYHLARQLAVLRQLSEALFHVRRALQLRADHLNSLHLLTLLLTASRQYQEAYQVLEGAIEEYPQNFNLLITKSKLEQLLFGNEQALQTCKTMLTLWKKVFEPSLESDWRGTGLLDKITTDQRSLVQLHFSDFSDNNSGSVRAESLAASKIEHALSEVASSLGSSLLPKEGPQKTWLLQTHLWLHLAEVFLSADRVNAANACIQEAASIHPLLHTVSYMRGHLHEYKGELSDAKQCYENAISINPMHVKSMEHLGLVLQLLNKPRQAEKVLREAVNVDPTSSSAWRHLGSTLQMLQEHESATECLMTAVDLDNTGPVLPFSVVPKALH